MLLPALLALVSVVFLLSSSVRASEDGGLVEAPIGFLTIDENRIGCDLQLDFVLNGLTVQNSRVAVRLLILPVIRGTNFTSATVTLAFAGETTTVSVAGVVSEILETIGTLPSDQSMQATVTVKPFNGQSQVCPGPPPTPNFTIRSVTITHKPVTKFGGISADPDLGALPLETPQSSGASTSVLAGVATAVTVGAVALAGTAWYARRRWLR